MTPAKLNTSTLRHLTERAFREVRFTTRLPARFGRRKLRVSPANHLSILKLGDAKFQPDLLGYVDRFVTKGMVVWDIGANMGLFTLPAASRGAHVVAFEPEAFNVHLLQTTTALNPDLQIEIVPVALAQEQGLARFSVSQRGRASSQLQSAEPGHDTGGVRQVTIVPTISADWALDHFPGPDLIKCDAEGAEVMILSGARKLLAKWRPVIVLEVGHSRADACDEILRAHDYVFASANTAIRESELLPTIGTGWEIIAIPREKLGQYLDR